MRTLAWWLLALAAWVLCVGAFYALLVVPSLGWQGLWPF